MDAWLPVRVARHGRRRRGSLLDIQAEEVAVRATSAVGAELMRYAIAIEKADSNYSAYVPDLPGCVATGDNVSDVEREIREAIRFHIEGLQADGMAIPQPTSIAEYIET